MSSSLSGVGTPRTANMFTPDVRPPLSEIWTALCDERNEDELRRLADPEQGPLVGPLARAFEAGCFDAKERTSARGGTYFTLVCPGVLPVMLGTTEGIQEWGDESEAQGRYKMDVGLEEAHLRGLQALEALLRRTVATECKTAPGEILRTVVTCTESNVRPGGGKQSVVRTEIRASGERTCLIYELEAIAGGTQWRKVSREKAGALLPRCRKGAGARPSSEYRKIEVAIRPSIMIDGKVKWEVYNIAVGERCAQVRPFTVPASMEQMSTATWEVDSKKQTGAHNNGFYPLVHSCSDSDKYSRPFLLHSSEGRPLIVCNVWPNQDRPSEECTLLVQEHCATLAESHIRSCVLDRVETAVRKSVPRIFRGADVDAKMQQLKTPRYTSSNPDYESSVPQYKLSVCLAAHKNGQTPAYYIDKEKVRPEERSALCLQNPLPLLESGKLRAVDDLDSVLPNSKFLVVCAISRINVIGTRHFTYKFRVERLFFTDLGCSRDVPPRYCDGTAPLLVAEDAPRESEPLRPRVKSDNSVVSTQSDDTGVALGRSAGQSREPSTSA